MPSTLRPVLGPVLRPTRGFPITPIKGGGWWLSESQLDLDFANNRAFNRSTGFNGSPASLLTVARASAGWYFDSSGTLQQAASNALRLNHDPATLAALGLLVEEQRTNLLLNSTSLSTQSVTVTAAAHTLSFYGTGTITLSGVSTAGPLVGTGANNRVALTFTPTAGSLTLTVSGDVRMANLELGSFATSPIITAGSQVTRAADQVSIATSAFGFSATEGTMLGWGTTETLNSALGNLVQAADSGNNRIAQYVGSSYLGLIVTDASVNQAVLNPATTNDSTFKKVASVYKANDFAVSLNGGSVQTDVAGTVPTVDTLRFGRQLTVYLNGHIKRVTYWNTRKPNAELQALSA